MDDLGKRLIKDRETAEAWRQEANRLEHRAKALRRDADELDRLAELARLQR